MLFTCGMCVILLYCDGREGFEGEEKGLFEGYCGTLLCNSLYQDGWTALMKASREGEAECVRILLERGAQANTQDEVSNSRPVQCLLLMYTCGIYVDCESDL